MGFSINFSRNTEDIINDKFKNPFWKNFILGWITWNWKVWYVTFFVSEEVVGNKILYMKNTYSYFDFYNLFPAFGFIINWLLIPLLISYLMVYQIPKRITHKFDKEEKENTKRRNLALADEIESETKVIKAQKENLQKKEELENLKEKKQFEEWDKEYGDLLNIENGKLSLNSLSNLIFEYSGNFKDNGGWNIPQIDFELLTLFSLFDSKHGDWHGTLTDKGKYFLKKYKLEQ